MAEKLLGKQFGHLRVAQKLSADEWHRMQYRCECDCGGEIILDRTQIHREVPDNCGCRKKIMRSDLTGQTIGKLYIIGPSDKRGPRGKRTVPLWECRCECGEICYRATDDLTNSYESMCAKCADISHTTKARTKAGFVGGTEISKLRSSVPYSTNTSGVRGVTYKKKENKWVAQLRFKNEWIRLGSYDKFEDAVKARRRAEEEYYGAFLEIYDAARKAGEV